MFSTSIRVAVGKQCAITEMHLCGIHSACAQIPSLFLRTEPLSPPASLEEAAAAPCWLLKCDCDVYLHLLTLEPSSKKQNCGPQTAKPESVPCFCGSTFEFCLGLWPLKGPALCSWSPCLHPAP